MLFLTRKEGATLCHVLRTSQAGPVVEQAKVYECSWSFLCFFLLFLIAKCCLFIVVFKTHPVMPVVLFGVQVQNTMYSITCSFCLKRRTNMRVGVA